MWNVAFRAYMYADSQGLDQAHQRSLVCAFANRFGIIRCWRLYSMDKHKKYLSDRLGCQTGLSLSFSHMANPAYSYLHGAWLKISLKYVFGMYFTKPKGAFHSFALLSLGKNVNN